MKFPLHFRTTAIGLSLALLCAACGHIGNRHGEGNATDGQRGADSTAIVRSYYNAARRLIDLNDSVPSSVLTDSAFHLLLDAADYSAGCRDYALCYSVHYALSRQYEAKNLFALQQQSEERMLNAALRLADAGRIAEARQQQAVTLLAQDDAVKATSLALQAYATAPKDSLDFRAQTSLVVSQAYIARSMYDSAALYLQRAIADWPAISHDPLYRISAIYIMGGKGRMSDAEELAGKAHDSRQAGNQRSEGSNLRSDASDVYAAMEEWRIIKALHEEHGNAPGALAAADRMLALGDSIADIEAAENLAQIHTLQHSSKMQLLEAQHAAKTAQMRAGLMFVLLVLLSVATAAYYAVRHQRQKTRHAVASQLEALRLAEEAQESEQNAWEENRALQKRYYEHLFAIVMPIFDARRTRTGSIDLTEQSWRLTKKTRTLSCRDLPQTCAVATRSWRSTTCVSAVL